MRLEGLIKYKFSPEPKIQNLVESYYIKNQGKSEGERIENAEIMLKEREKVSSMPILGVFSLYDYWYWIYIYSLNYHINADGSLYKHSFDKEKEVYIESFADKDKEKNSVLLDKMFEILQQKKLQLPDQKSKVNAEGREGALGYNLQTRFLSRQDSDYLLENTEKEVLSMLGFDSKKYTIKHISMEVFLQAYSLGLWGNADIMTHIDGYRLRADGLISTIFAGHSKYGGVSYFDSFWKEASFGCLLSRFVVIEK